MNQKEDENSICRTIFEICFQTMFQFSSNQPYIALWWKFYFAYDPINVKRIGIHSRSASSRFETTKFFYPGY